jgi:hypothetical protein
LGIIGALATHAPDTIATYRQEDVIKRSIELGDPSAKVHPKSITTAAKEIFAKNGIKGFFRGGAARCVLFTGCALTIPPFSKAASRFLSSLFEE